MVRFETLKMLRVIYYHKKHTVKTLKYYYVRMTWVYDLIKALPVKAVELQRLVFCDLSKIYDNLQTR